VNDIKPTPLKKKGYENPFKHDKSEKSVDSIQKKPFQLQVTKTETRQTLSKVFARGTKP
jgi:hypothetical protein